MKGVAYCLTRGCNGRRPRKRGSAPMSRRVVRQTVVKPGLSLRKVWEDEHALEFEVTIADGASIFVTRAYGGLEVVAEMLASLERFKSQIHGGIYDLRLGAFGPEFAGGALEAVSISTNAVAST